MLDGDLSRPAADIENFLTSIVFDACRLSRPGEALVPFLGLARTDAGTPLAGLLAEADGPVRYDIWLNWPGEEAPAADVAGGEPELVLTMPRPGRPPALVLVEAKLWNGKSSLPSRSRLVTDQLGKVRTRSANTVPADLRFRVPARA